MICTRCGKGEEVEGFNFWTDTPSGVDDHGHLTFGDLDVDVGVVHSSCLTEEEMAALNKMNEEYESFREHHQKDFWRGYLNVSHVKCGCPWEVK